MTTKADNWLIQAVQPYTCTSPERVIALRDAVRYVVRAGIPGAIVECGVWKGGSTMAAMLTLIELRDLRDCVAYDTFEGMPPAGPEDVDLNGTTNVDQGDSVNLFCDQATVERNLASTGYPPDRIHTVKGLVEDTIPRWCPKEIAVLRLDTDWYQSTRHELIHLWPRLSPGGVLLIDDYGHWQGARKAVDEFFADRADAPLLSRIDYTGVIGVKR